MSKVNFTAEDLAKTAIKYRQQLLMMVVIGLEQTKQHMTIRPGIRYKEVVGELTGGIELGPYSETRLDESDINVAKRELETFFGSVVKPFSPNSVYQSLWGSSITKGEALKDTEITKMVLGYLMKKLSESLNKAIWKAKRKESGNTTVDLFNGFDTIAETEIAAGTISTANKNLFEFTEKIDKTNAVDLLKSFYRSADDVLRGEKVKLFISNDIYDAYVDDYQSTVGAIAYNTQFDKTFLEGSHNLCELVPLSNKAESGYIQLTPQANMLIGVDQESDLENITVEKHAAFILQFIATLFFGCQYESINKERLLVGKLLA
jgi:hypothetical protein